MAGSVVDSLFNTLLASSSLSDAVDSLPLDACTVDSKGQLHVPAEAPLGLQAERFLPVDTQKRLRDIASRAPPSIEGTLKNRLALRGVLLNASIDPAAVFQFGLVGAL